MNDRHECPKCCDLCICEGGTYQCSHVCDCELLTPKPDEQPAPPATVQPETSVCGILADIQIQIGKCRITGFPPENVHLTADQAKHILSYITEIEQQRDRLMEQPAATEQAPIHQNCTCPLCFPGKPYMAPESSTSTGSGPRSIDGKFSTDGQRIFNTVSGEEIPRDEPLFLLRARDNNAVSLLRRYAELCEQDGCNDLHIGGIRQVYEKFKDFRRNYSERMKQPGITKDLKLEQPSASGGLDLKFSRVFYEACGLEFNIPDGERILKTEFVRNARAESAERELAEAKRLLRESIKALEELHQVADSKGAGWVTCITGAALQSLPPPPEMSG